jgi:hypothetical protein
VVDRNVFGAESDGLLRCDARECSNLLGGDTVAVRGEMVRGADGELGTLNCWGVREVPETVKRVLVRVLRFRVMYQHTRG